jgi:hypothetical protein
MKFRALLCFVGMISCGHDLAAEQDATLEAQATICAGLPSATTYTNMACGLQSISIEEIVSSSLYLCTVNQTWGRVTKLLCTPSKCYRL